MFSYLLKVTLCWAVFYGIYHLLLGRETFFRLNRWYLLVTALLGLMIPAIEFDLTLAAEPQIYYLQPITIGVEQLETVIVTASGEEQGFDFWQMLVWVYWAGVVVAATRFGYGLYQIFKLYRAGKIEPGRGYRFVTTPAPHVPFSFFKNLFWSQKFVVSEEDRHSIIRHEEAHIFQWHSLDVMLLELAGVFLWCSPFVYLYKNAMKTTHEYLADAYVTEDFSKKQYGRLLLRQSQAGSEGRLRQKQIAISNSLFSSQLKKRIVMMTKNKSSRQAALKYLALVPALAMLFMAFAQSEQFQEIGRSPFPGKIVDTDEFVNTFEAIHCKTSDCRELIDFILPQFPGDKAKLVEEGAEKSLHYSNDNMKAFVKKHLKYPEEALRKKMHGFVMSTFWVEPDGSISDPVVYRSIGGGCEEEVLRIISLMPKFTPGKINGIPARRMVHLPVHFHLDNQTGEDNISFLGLKNDTLPVGEIFKVVEEMPRFPGCEEMTDAAEREGCAQSKMLEFIYKNIKYPAEARKNGVEGMSVVKFIVEKDGSISEAETVRAIGSGCDEEVLKMVYIMPKWVPGKQRGQAVRTQFMLPVKFKLSAGDQPAASSGETEPGKKIFPGTGDEKPLIIVDGVQFHGDIQTEINPADILTINVLKDENSTSQYGDAGRKGVIVITTKNAKAGKAANDGSKSKQSQVDQMPRFAGCENEADKDACSNSKLLAFIIDNLKYPEAAKKAGVEGMVVVKFVVAKDGSIQNAEVVKGIGGDCDEEALRVVNAMPNWEPATQRGKAVGVEMSLPFNFALPKIDNEASVQPSDKLEVFDVYPNPSGKNGFYVKYKTGPGNLVIRLTDVSGKFLAEMPVANYDGTEQTAHMAGIFEKKAAKSNVLVSLYLDGKHIESKTVVMQ